jgi:hypothetical protein
MVVHTPGTEDEVLLNRDFIVSARRITTATGEYTDVLLSSGTTIRVSENLNSLRAAHS